MDSPLTSLTGVFLLRDLVDLVNNTMLLYFLHIVVRCGEKLESTLNIIADIYPPR